MFALPAMAFFRHDDQIQSVIYESMFTPPAALTMDNDWKERK
jgi:hypothetical protein